MDVNDDASNQVKRAVLRFFASKLAATKSGQRLIDVFT